METKGPLLEKLLDQLSEVQDQLHDINEKFTTLQDASKDIRFDLDCVLLDISCEIHELRKKARWT